MQREGDFSSREGAEKAAGQSTGLPPAASPRAAAAPSRRGRPALRLLAASLAFALAFSATPAVINSAGLHFGLVSAVKSKVKELGKKVREKMAPGFLSAVAVSSTTARLSWRDNAKGEEGFRIERRTAPAGSYFQLAVAPAGATAYTDTGLSAGTTYYYRVRAFAEGLLSSYSNEASVVTPLPGSGPGGGGGGGGASLDSISASPPSIATGTFTTLTANITNPGGTVLTYTWNAASGTLSGSGSSVTWTAPVSSGSYTVSCTISDGAGFSETKSVSVKVTFPSNIRFTLLVSPGIVMPNNSAAVVSSVTTPDPALVPLTYAWIAASGTVTGSGAAIGWTAPADTGTYTVECEVSDGTDTVRKSADIIVATGPVITSLLASPSTISTGAASGVICVATAPAGALTYAWSAASGSFTGSGSSVTWTAPLSTGAYTVTVMVSNGLGGSDTRSVTVRVANPPVITSLEASPGVVRPLGVSTVTCSATDPGGDTLSYVWTVLAGTMTVLADNRVSWSAPESTGSYPVTCSVSNAAGGTTSRSVQVVVASAPVITSLITSPASVSTGAASSIICVATAPAGALTYAWSAASGSFSGSGSSVTWTAPSSTGSYTVTVQVSDGLGGTATQSVSVRANNPPVIYSIFALPQVVNKLGVSTVTAAAVDPDGAPLTYSWTASSGSVAVLADGQIAWTAPDSTGTFSVNLQVTDDQGGAAAIGVQLMVASAPVITSLTASPAAVSTGAASSIICVATAPAGALSYAWSAASGSFSGSGSSVTWTAPASTGAYTVTVMVTDGLGGSATSSISLRANNPPLIAALTAAPPVVGRLDVSTVTAAAYDPDGGPLTYIWSGADGAFTVLADGQIAWTAPDSTGTRSVTVQVTDDYGASATAGVQILVASAPIITSLTVLPPSVSTGGAALVVCVATSPAGSLSYAWSAASGSFSGSGSSVTWTAPSSTGVYTLTVQVTDGLGGAATQSVTVRANNQPVVTALTAAPQTVRTLAVSTITAAAYDPDGGPLNYNWTVSTGSFAVLADGQIAWTAPGSTGPVTVNVQVTDAEGAATGFGIQLLVASAPVITQLTAAPVSVATGAISSILCVATAAAGNLSYAWNAGSGTLTGSGPSVSWTAPDSTGSFVITAQVYDGLGGVDTRRVAVRTNNPPVVNSLTATPQVVDMAHISTITSVAFDPDGGLLAHSWSANGGDIAILAPGQIAWTAPNSTGTKTITLQVQDDQGDTVTVSVQVLVASAPVITSLTAAPIAVDTGTQTNLVCVATAPAGTLSYSWFAGSGTISGSGPDVSWTAPLSTGTYVITVQVHDGLGGAATRSVAVRCNNQPVIDSLTPSPQVVRPLAVSTITASAYDPDNGPLTYIWSASTGSVRVLVGGMIAWTAPDSTGTQTVTLQVTDDQGDIATLGVQVTVASAPIINSLSASPVSVATGAVSNLVCLATAPAGILAYNWYAASGSVSGSGSAVAWTAPDSTGVYVITAQVTDGLGGAATQSVAVRANNPPVVASLSAVPQVVGKLAVSTITAAAADPDGGPLTYAWSASAGGIAVLADGQIAWTAPDSTGTQTITLQVTDDQGAFASAVVQVLTASAPVITALTASPASVSTGAASGIVCVATAAAGTLSYNWYAASGTLTGSGASVTWTAPDSTAAYVVTVQVTDGLGGAATQSVAVRANNPPAIASLATSPPTVGKLSISTVTAAAADPDGGPLTYAWSATAGGIAVLADGQIAWTSPDSTGTQTVTLMVTDDHGATASLSAQVLVASAPVIASLTVSPSSLSTGAAAGLVCVATAPAGTLSYSWYAASGAVSGSGASVNWTAPDSTGSYVVTVLVSDGLGGVDTRSAAVLVNNPPVIASLSAAPEVAGKLAVSTVTAAAYDPDGGPLTYAWSASSGTIAVLADGQAAWTAPDSTGTYTVTLQVTDASGAAASAGVQVLVASAPVITALTAVPASVSTGAAANLVCLATAPAGTLSYSWFAASGAITGSGANVTWTAPDSTGAYVITAQVSDGLGGTDTRSVAVRANNPPVISAIAAAPPTVGKLAISTITAAAYDPDGGPLSYAWTAGAGAVAVLADGQIAWTSPDSTGTYSVSLRVTDDHGATADSSVQLLVASAPVINSLTASPAAVSTGAASGIVCVATAPAGALSYSWFAASGAITGSGASVTWTAPSSTGVFVVTAQVSDGLGGTDTRSVAVRANNPPVIASLTASPSTVGKLAISTVTAAAADPDGGPLTYNWSASAGGIAVLADGQIEWTAPDSTGTQTVTLQVTDEFGESASLGVQVLVASAPVIDSLTASPASVSTGAASNIVCVATAPAGTLSYSWYAASGAITGSGASVTWTAPDTTGAYVITLQVSDGLGGTDTRSVAVRANNPPVIASLSAAPPVIGKTAISTVTAAAYDPDGGPLTYSWTAPSGAVNVLADGQIAWTSPDSTGTFTLSLRVTDNNGATADSSVQLLVASAPVINSLTASPAAVSTGAASGLVCVATAPAGALSYSWFAASGAITGSGASVTWTAPSSTGAYVITVQVSDGLGGAATRSVAVRANNPPVIGALAAAPPTVGKLAISTVTAAAYDPDGGTLTYDWTAASGTVLVLSDGQIAWTSPDSTGTFTVSLQVTDDQGAAASAAVQVLVASAPVITSLTASPAAVSTGAASSLVCVATAPAGTLSYSWFAASGAITGSGASVTWTAPSSTGAYVITVQVSDGLGGAATRSVAVRSNNPPVIASLTASPPTVGKLEISTITAAAADPDGGPLTYDWTVAAGAVSVLSDGRIEWTAPDSTGTYTVSLQVTDDQGATATSSLQVLVASAPVITSLTASPASVSTGAVSNIVCVATAAAGSLSYGWYAASGTITGSGAAVTWTAPTEPGAYVVTLQVTDGLGGAATQSVAVRANNPPVISSIGSAPPIVVRLGVSTVTAAAYDPDGGPLTYNWSATGGAVAVLAPGQIAWTAPDSTGTFTVSLQVLDAQGASASAGLQVVVASAPVITTLTASPATVARGADATLVCAATAPAGAPISYSWTAGSGTITGSGASVTWTAPGSTGTFSAFCTADAGALGGVSSGTLWIPVNSPPAVISVTANPQRVSPLHAAGVTCAASDPDGTPLAYTWAATGGSLSGSGASVTWTAPASSGSYSLSCQVEDGNGGSAQGGTTVAVSSVPLISALTSTPAAVPSGGAATLACVVQAPDNDTLSYSWSAASGSITGSGTSVTWAAPAATGTYAATCGATADTGGGYAARTVWVLVNNPPVISALNAVPGSVSTGTASSLTCSATDPDNLTIFYAWTAASGTITGSGASVTWTAPESSGTYLVTCQVSDGEGGADSETVPVTATVNSPPTIASLSASPPAVSGGANSSISCAASDPDGDALTYAWTAASGTITGSGADVTWTAPASTAAYTVSVEVTDGHGGSATRSLSVRVTNPPVITSLTRTPASVLPLDVSTVTCVASDPDNGPVTYDWSAASGTIVNLADGQIGWHAPDSTGTFTVSVVVTDSEGSSAQSSVNILVSSSPIIVSLAASPASVSTGAVTSVNCTAEVPGGAALTYTWTAASGTLTGSGADVQWTAPVSTGSYTVTCRVSSPGGFDERSISVVVNNPPVVSALAAVPALVSPTSVSTVTCTAADPDNGPLTYLWSATGGALSQLDPWRYEWTAPVSTGSYSVTCEARDANGGAAVRSVAVGVSSAPLISSLSASPSSVLVGGAATLTCSAADPDNNDALTYSWSAASGTVTGSGASVTWTAPASSGSYSVGCSVSDGHDGIAVRWLSVPVGGVRLWTKQLGTADGDTGNAVTLDGAGNVFVAGETAGDLGGTNAGNMDLFLTAYDPAGAALWTRQLGTTTYDTGRAAAADGTGGVFVAGETAGPMDDNAHLGGKDYFLVRYSTEGAKLWSRQGGTNSDDSAYGAAVDAAGNVYVAGETAGSLDGANRGDRDAFIAKYSPAGSQLWVRQLGSTTYDTARAVAVDTSGNIYVTGYTDGSLDGNDNLGSTDLFVAKYSAAGAKLWTKQYGTAGSDSAYGVAADADGNVFVTGDTWDDFGGALQGSSDFFVLKLAPSGAQLWVRQTGSAGAGTYDFSNSIAALPDGSAIFAGQTNGDFDGANLGGMDAVLAKYDKDGNLIWKKQFGTDQGDAARGVAIDGSVHVYTTGETAGDLDGNVNPAPGSSDIFLTKYVR